MCKWQLVLIGVIFLCGCLATERVDNISSFSSLTTSTTLQTKTTVSLDNMNPKVLAALSICDEIPADALYGCRTFKGCRSSRDKCYWDTAIKYNDSTVCELLIDRAECYEYIAPDLGDGLLCDKAKDKYTCIRYVYQRLNTYPNSTGDCQGLHDDNLKDYCLFVVSTRLEDKTLCDVIKNTFVSNECYLSLGISLSDPSLCDKITSGERDWCYYKVSLSLNDTSLCKKIENDGYGWRTFCNQRRDIS